MRGTRRKRLVAPETKEELEENGRCHRSTKNSLLDWAIKGSQIIRGARDKSTWSVSAYQIQNLLTGFWFGYDYISS